jgi:hypothetical protein
MTWLLFCREQLNWIEDHYYRHRLGNVNGEDEDLKALGQELADLLEEDAK